MSEDKVDPPPTSEANPETDPGVARTFLEDCANFFRESDAANRAQIRAEAEAGKAVRAASAATAPTSATAPKMTTEQSIRNFLKLKEEHFNKIYDKLSTSVKAEEKQPKLIEVQFKLLQNQLKEVNKSRGGLLKLLIQQDRSEDYKSEEDLQYALEEKFLLIELEVTSFTTPSTSTPGQDKKAPDVDPIVEIREMAQKLYQLRETAAAEVTTQLDSLHILTQTKEVARVPAQLDLVKIYWEQFSKVDGDFMQRLNQFGTPDEIHFQSTKNCVLLQRKMEVERKANDLIKENKSSLDATLPMSDDHPFLKNRKGLPKLGGNVKEWLPFWSHFQEVDQHQQLSDSKKLTELVKATVEGSEAREIVMAYSGDGQSYTLARDHLRNMFGRPNVLIKVYVRELLQLGLDKAMGKPMEFRRLVTTLTATIRNLEMLGVTANMCAQVIYPIVELCLPKTALTAWQHHPGYKDELDKLMAFLQEEVIHERERLHANLQVPKASTAKEGDKEKKKKEKAAPTTTSFHSGGVKAEEHCSFCNGDHWAGKCTEAWKMTLQERTELLQENGGCTVCLKKGHSTKDCSRKGKVTCKRCQQPHRLILCPAPKPKTTTKSGKSSTAGTSSNLARAEQEEEDPSDGDQEVAHTSSSYNNFVDDAEVPLQIIPIIVTGPDGKVRTVRALLDTGSQKSYITESLQEELQFQKMGEEDLTHQLFGGISTCRRRHQIVKLHAASVDATAPADFNVWCIQTISGSLKPPPEGNYIIEFRKKGVIFQQQPNSDPVDVLIGNDVAPRLYTGRKVDLGTGPVAMETQWGWVLCGKLPRGQIQRNSSRSMTVTSSLLNLPLSSLWELDSLGIQDEATTQSKEELAALTQQHFDETVSRTEEGRYRVTLPFLSGSSSSLPTNYYGAEKRMKATADKLRKEGYLQQYHALFQQWEDEGMIEEVIDCDKDVGHYLPHRAVVKLSSSTTPIRPVFDASAKPRGKPSLNDCLEKGPNYLELIPTLLTRFRLKRIGVTADIRKAFQQIEVAPEHRDFLRFIWISEDGQTIKIFRHSRVVFGVTSSPFLLAATLKHHLEQAAPSHLHTAVQLLGSLYVDNVAHSLSTESELTVFILQCKELLEPAHFDLRGWEHGPRSDGKETPLLGLIWNTKSDMLSLDLKDVMELLSVGIVKTPRSLLSVAQMLYDPLGLVSPFSIVAKMSLRKVHQCKLGWDGKLPLELQMEFQKWSKQIHLLSEIKIPRYSGWEEMQNRSLHIFSDASGEAFAATAFIRGETEDGVKVSLLQSKAKLSPKKATIPRLELLGCLIGSRLAQTIKEDIRCPQLPVTYWTDSSTALAWIKGEGPWATFVNNRVQEIRKTTNNLQWRHCPGKLNPADLPSRGCTAKKLLESKWWEGPAWLYLPETTWPNTMGEISEEEVSKEKRKTVAVNMTLVPNHPMEEFLRISDYPRIVSAVAKWMRVKNNLLHRVQRKQNANQLATVVPATTTEEERKEAEFTILRHIQHGLLEDPSRIPKLRPFLEDGIIRTKTRLLQGEEVDINPIILPDRNEFTRRIIRHLHEESCHMGTQLLLAKVRERYWLLNGRKTVRSVIKSCWICRKFNTRRLEVDEPPLPKTRTGTGAPFHVTGVDMAGPLILRDKKKVWVALFTCASYRAIHLEVVESMSTDEFFIAFRRFVARRGKPVIVYSDNGLNFTGAGAALRKLYESKVQAFAHERRLDWRFNCPLAPFWGGFYERLIGLTKQLLRKTLGQRIVHQKELEVLLLEVEETLNNRPLTYLTEDPDDPVPLTPNMLVRNSGLAYFPELDVRDAASARAAHRRVQKLREGLRSRFRKEYLGQLKFERARRTTTINLRPGDVVLVEEPKKRHEWPLAVVVEAVNVGRDGVARKFRLKTKTGIITRAAQLLYPMELADEEDPAQQ